jgi:hypothetical protein
MSGGGSGTSFRATVRFKARRGEVITGTVDMVPWALARLKEHDPIQVAYLPDDPHLFRVPGQFLDQWFIIVILTIIGMPFSLIGGLVVVFTIREHRKSAVTGSAQ